MFIYNVNKSHKDYLSHKEYISHREYISFIINIKMLWFIKLVTDNTPLTSTHTNCLKK